MSENKILIQSFITFKEIEDIFNKKFWKFFNPKQKINYK